ncbi:hypothetical protein HanIR_Chr01g0029191 [Helianthus annuus]|nr:hypothetical protein HanIR_Chr01g0029191 [Helianthus annuus]
MHNLPSTPNKSFNPILNSAHVPNTMHNLATTPNKNFNPILNSAHVPNTMHNLPTTPNKSFNPILNSTHVPNTMHNLPTTPNKNFNPILNSAHVPNTKHNLPTTPKKNFNPILNSAHVPNTMHNLPTTPKKNFNPILNSAHVPNTMHNLPSTPNKNFNPILNSAHVPNTKHNLPITPNKSFIPILNSAHVPNTMHNLPSTPNKNFIPILNSTPVPNTIHNLNPNHGSNQASPPVSYFPSKDPANWDYGLLAAIVRPKASPICDPFKNRPQSNSVHDLNKTPAQNSFTQGGSMFGNQPSPTFGQKDGFPVPCRPCYDLNSPPRSELDAVSSRITGSLPFAPITPDTQRKDRDESQRIADGDNHCVGDSTSSAVSTTQKEHLVCEEGDESGIDLNKTPNQKTPARRKKHRLKVIREGKPRKKKVCEKSSARKW